MLLSLSRPLTKKQDYSKLFIPSESVMLRKPRLILFSVSLKMMNRIGTPTIALRKIPLSPQISYSVNVADSAPQLPSSTIKDSWPLQSSSKLSLIKA